MVTFVDTSALYAYLDAADAHHAHAVEAFGALLDGEEPLLTHGYVVVETTALVQRRLGIAAARALHDDLLPVIDVVPVDPVAHAAAVHGLLGAGRRELSLVDWTSCVVMRERRIVRAFAFDEDFRSQGFEVVPALT